MPGFKDGHIGQPLGRTRKALVMSTGPAQANYFKSSFIELSGLRHHIRDTGEIDTNGPVAVFMHGFAGSTESWDEVFPLLATGGCRAIAIDRVGFGLTERPVVPTFPPPPKLPFAEEVAQGLESLVDSGPPQQQSGPGVSLPDPRQVLAFGLRRPQALAPRLPWEFSQFGQDPYSADFAISRVLWPLLRKLITPPSSGTRPIYLVGHSAGGSVAIRALVDAASAPPSNLPPGTALAGLALIAPAALDPREEPDLFQDRQDGPGLFDRLPLPAEVRRRAELEALITGFRAIVSLPDAFGLPTARRIAERDLKEVMRGQCHERMSAPEFEPRVAALVDKYSEPVRRFPDDWDKALLNVYRADFASNQEGLRGRSLLTAALDAKRKLQGVRILVSTGDDDRIVSPQASLRVADLLAAERFEKFNETGHLPMDERPEEVAALLLDFFQLHATASENATDT